MSEDGKNRKKKKKKKGAKRSRGKASRSPRTPSASAIFKECSFPAMALRSSAATQPPGPLPGVLVCKKGDTINCSYEVDGVIVIRIFLFWGPDENGDTVPDRFDNIGTADGNEVAGVIEAIPAGYSYLAWSFSPANEQPWTGLLSIQINDGPPLKYVETSDNEAESHQAGILILAEPT